ncbi:Rieske (2Fe-2S) protein [Chitinophaga tropicalis]|uniref:Rieske 2Fe-2S domain-containing protein n=1 Tax=Chitinophaga tropicalis TaxID=2683588 RepID=A0A7K1TYZ6_9BACT|nr:Rieske 2Fe-2S domain-containing protein [Chitinophaga tropicalis]MVT06995.1 Rieske 2Fe-2S domain-containing protein [Chitinophaga tropicalis]
MAKQYNWHRLSDLYVIDGEITVIEVSGKKICMTRYNGQLYAFAYKCPHAGGIMADGYIDDSGNVVCPLHRYRFNVKNGYNSSGEGFYLKTYPLEDREDGIYLGLEKTGLFGW